MRKVAMLCAVLCLLLTAGCATYEKDARYYGTTTEYQIEYGIVRQIQPTVLTGHGGTEVGAITGAIAGGIMGSMIGRWPGPENALASLAGAVGGGIIGSVIGREADTVRGYRVLVEMDSGSAVAIVVRHIDDVFVGQRVCVYFGYDHSIIEPIL